VAESQEPAAEKTDSQPSGASNTPENTNSAVSVRPNNKSNYDWVSPIVLCALLIILISATRVYIGGPDGMLVVWKGELSFNETVVNLADYVDLPKSELAKHPQLFMQMEEMDLLNPSYERPLKRKRIRKNSGESEGAQSTVP
jgi:hypothetical protein